MKESFLLYHSFYPPIKDMSLEDKGKLLDAIFQWHKDGTIPELPTGAYIAFKFMESQFTRDLQSYNRICQRNKDNINKRWGKNASGKNDIPDYTKNTSGKNGIPDYTKNTDTDTDTDTDIKEESIKKKNQRFLAPSLFDLQNYFSDIATNRNLTFSTTGEAEKFHAFYTSKGWMVGKNKMVDWKAAVRNWMKNVKPVNGKKIESYPQFNERPI